MRLNVAQILILCREAVNKEHPENMYPSFTRTAYVIKFLHGASDALQVMKRRNEAGMIDDVILGIKRDGIAHLLSKIREADNMRDAVTSKLEVN